jgi:hypothetical protein
MIKSMVLVNNDIVRPQRNVVQVQGLQIKLIVVKQDLEPNMVIPS